MTTVGIVIACLSLFCFFLAWKDRDKPSLFVGIIFGTLALVLVHYGSLGRPAKCAVGYYKMITGVYENKELHFIAHGVSLDVRGDSSVKFCKVPFANVHTMQWQDVYVWLIDGEHGQELYLSPPSVEVDTD